MEIPPFEQKYNNDRLRRIDEETESVVKELLEKGFNFECNYARKLEVQMDENNEEIEGTVYWLELRTDMSKDESNSLRAGKLFVPDNYYSELVCLYAGLPGENTVTLESRYANSLMSDGKVVWVSRHNGVKFSEDNNKYFINADEIIEDASYMEKENVANKLSGDILKDFSEEPQADLSVFLKQDKINAITLIGHSFGATSIINSVLNLEQEGLEEEEMKKIKKTIFINGLLGDGTFPEDDNEMVGGTRLPVGLFTNTQSKKAKDFFSTDEPIEMKSTLRNLLIRNGNSKLPDGIELIITASPTDAYLTTDGAEHYLEGRESGLLIYDLTHSDIQPEQSSGVSRVFGPEFGEITSDLVASANKESKEEYGASQHAAPNFTAETLERLVNLRVTGKHRVAFIAKE